MEDRHDTTPLRKIAKNNLKTVMSHKKLFALVEELDCFASSTPIEKRRDIGSVIWGYGEKERMPYSMLESIELEFEGKQFFAPRDYDVNLTSLFDDYMTPPPPDERLPHFCRVYWKDGELNA